MNQKITEIKVKNGAGPREWIGLAVLALPTLLVSIDLFVMLLALPSLSAALKASSVQQLWITDIYGFLLSGFLVTMGTLGDRIGRRKLLLIGAAAFGAASIMAAFSTSAGMLIVARALLGVAGATLAPSTLSLISHMFKDPRQRAISIGIWLASFSTGSIIGPMIGGVVLEHFWWGSVFLIGVPAMVLLLLLGPWLLPEYRNPEAGRIDLTSVALYIAAILPTTFGIKELARNGWQPAYILAIVAGVAMGWAFVHRQRSLASPLLDLKLFANRAFSTTLGSMLAYTMLSGATMVFVTQYLQLVGGLSPLQAGLGMVPGMLSSIVGFQLSPLLARKIRPAYLISAGLAISVSGLIVISSAGATNGLTPVILGFALIGFGTGPLITLGTNLIISSAPPEKAGSAAAISQTSNEFGFALGVAILGSIGTAVYRTQVTEHIPAGVTNATASATRDTLAGATAVAHNLTPQLGDALLASAREAFASGMHTVTTISAVLITGVILVILATLRQMPPLKHSSDESL